MRALVYWKRFLMVLLLDPIIMGLAVFALTVFLVLLGSVIVMTYQGDAAAISFIKTYGVASSFIFVFIVLCYLRGHFSRVKSMLRNRSLNFSDISHLDEQTYNEIFRGLRRKEGQ